MADTEIWHLDVVGNDGSTVRLASGTPSAIAFAYEQMQVVFPAFAPSRPHFRDKAWTLSVCKPVAEAAA